MKPTIGVIGLGSIGMRHAKNLHAIGYNVHGWDPDSNIKEFNRFQNQHVDNLIALSDAIVIASPTDRHYEHMLNCRNKPFLVEKPIAHIITDGLLLSRRIAECMVGYNLRFHSCVKKAKEWLDAGKIGIPLWANFTLGQFSEKPPYLRDGVILNWSHELDLALYLLGPGYVSASSTRLTDGKDDMSDILLNHKSGCRTTVHLDYLSKLEVRSFHIVGDDGSLGSNLVERRSYRWGTDNSSLVEKFIGSDSWDSNYVEELTAFLDRIDGKETIGCTGREGLDVLKLCLDVRKQAGLA